jgi:hypothetical protein
VCILEGRVKRAICVSSPRASDVLVHMEPYHEPGARVPAES